MKSTEQIIRIHPKAPNKPAMGTSCNGCGVCCAAEPCPISLALLWSYQAPCKALIWHNQSQQYRCGMVSNPSHFLSWLPQRFDALASKLFKRWIAADTLCDADVETTS